MLYICIVLFDSSDMMQAARRTRFSYVILRMRKVTQELFANYSSDLTRSIENITDSSRKTPKTSLACNLCLPIQITCMFSG